VLQNTFCHIPTISLKTEQRLWEAGLHHWDQCESPRPGVLSPRKLQALRERLPESRVQLARSNAFYFSELLPASEQWRLFAHFRNKTAFLDIETTGLGGPDDHITTAVLYDGCSVRHYVHGQNLHDFPAALRAYQLLVTFNGKCFDLPFIERAFGIRLAGAHIDLRYVFKSLSYTGGLKAIETSLGLDRKELRDLDGYCAVLLWSEYRRRGDRKVLETLLAYNAADVLNLEPLMVTAYNMKLSHTPFLEMPHLPRPVIPRIPFRADPEVIERTHTRRWGT
jgi:uncharacterized protein YprB with RNaseH-like and TPR domain